MLDYFAHYAELLNPTRPLGAMVVGCGLFVLGVMLSWAIRQGLKQLLLREHSERIDAITLSFLSRLLTLALWLVLATLYAHLVPALNRLSTALLAGVSLMSVIIGFAAQTTLGNLISGISLVLYKPFRRGDRLQVTAPTDSQFETGVVKEISLGFTVLETDDGRDVVVANGAMAQQTMIRLPRPASETIHPSSSRQEAPEKSLATPEP